MQAYPHHIPKHLRVYRRTIEDAIRMLEQLRGELPTLHWWSAEPTASG